MVQPLPETRDLNDQCSLGQAHFGNLLDSSIAKAISIQEGMYHLGSLPHHLTATFNARSSQPLSYLSQLSPNVSSLDYNVITGIYRSSSSRPNFAWRLARYFFTDDEMRGRNCFGRKGKLAVCPQKLTIINRLVFEFFPLGENDSRKRLWSDCTVAIDKGIRNTTHRHYMKPSSQSMTNLQVANTRVPDPQIADLQGPYPHDIYINLNQQDSYTYQQLKSEPSQVEF